MHDAALGSKRLNKAMFDWYLKRTIISYTTIKLIYM